MANPSKAKGTRGETKVARYFTEHGIPTTRKALAGSDDEGDLRVIMPDGTEVTVEVKSGKQTRNPTRSQMKDWKSQTLDESMNSGCPAVLVVVRYYRRFEDSEVWIPNADECGWTSGWTMVYIDEYVRMMGGK